ncbi:PucR family transcriptional regulator [Siminovitchia sp. 179-K 8D1 HS]|uniref:PucR family transcriptional regulator n=1 Tax=Siminovitchia sp. 179-K 8D1 HS TaxID=3142385 RepID=UPI0039A07CBA
MMNEFTLKVKDILSREHFKHAKVLAGSRGLGRIIRWVHVLEVADFESLIHGGELILTTGVGLQTDFHVQLTFVKKLIQSNAAGICIERGQYFREIHEDILELANEHDFPIILFEETVKFVDITQDLHSLIINRHYDLLSYLDTSSRKFIELSMSSNGILKILQELYQYFHHTVMFLPAEGRGFYFPADQKELHDIAVHYFEMDKNKIRQQQTINIENETFVVMPVKGPGHTWGCLFLHTTSSAPEEFHYLILDRAALSIAQIMLRNRTIEERKQHSEDKFVRNILQGREFDENEMHTHLPFMHMDMCFRVFVLQFQPFDQEFSEEEWEDINLQRTMLIRSLFKRHGFSPAVSATKDEIAVIAAFIGEEKEKAVENLKRIIQHIDENNEKKLLFGKKYAIGIGRDYSRLEQLTKSYKEAKEVIGIHANVYLYDEIGIYRLFLPLKNTGELEAYVLDYLGPILEYDRTTESDLFQTLKVYLECGGAKKEAAEKLFIVRQTLYHRLEKIEQLLGSDFMNPNKRIAIETALKAYDLIKAVK